MMICHCGHTDADNDAGPSDVPLLVRWRLSHRCGNSDVSADEAYDEEEIP